MCFFSPECVAETQKLESLSALTFFTLLLSHNGVFWVCFIDLRNNSNIFILSNSLWTESALRQIVSSQCSVRLARTGILGDSWTVLLCKLLFGYCSNVNSIVNSYQIYDSSKTLLVPDSENVLNNLKNYYSRYERFLYSGFKRP